MAYKRIPKTAETSGALTSIRRRGTQMRTFPRDELRKPLPDDPARSRRYGNGARRRPHRLADHGSLRGDLDLGECGAIAAIQEVSHKLLILCRRFVRLQRRIKVMLEPEELAMQ